MNIKRFHEITVDHRPQIERFHDLKETMLLFLNDSKLDYGINVMRICISLTNDYLYCSKPLKLRYTMPIEPTEDDHFRFEYDWNNFYYEQRSDETAYRFFCQGFFETVVRILYFKGFTDTEIENAYFDKLSSEMQLSLF